MSEQPTNADLDNEVQGLPLTGYKHACMRTLLLQVRHAADARAFLRNLLNVGWIDFGGRRTPPPTTFGLNVGITYEGMRLLGTHHCFLSVLRTKSRAFADGPAQRAAHYLGDAGPSAVERWNPVFGARRAHIWIALHADDKGRLELGTRKLRKLRGAETGLHGWDVADGVPDGQHMFVDGDRGNRQVHFGFRDNITAPTILDEFPRREGRADGAVVKHKAGELLLGYGNDQGTDLWTASPRDEDVASFLRNGSFGILRQMRQDVARFEAYVESQAAALAQQGYAHATPEYLKAKMCGRWATGEPVRPHQDVPSGTWTPSQHDVDFESDPQGWGCPFGAHIRRANPRADPMLPRRDRVLFRRGIPYGPRYADGPADAERGLLGLFFCSRIEDQFELLVSEWLEKNPLGPANMGRSKDPLSGNHDDPRATFHIPLPGGGDMFLENFQGFVRTRGTLYALFPSRRALRTIARA
jgi:deferrochelatase/peroxidase EfeB